MTPHQHAALLLELADELYAVNKTRPIDSPNRKRGDLLMQRARAAAAELGERRRPTAEQLQEAFADGCFPEPGSSLMLDELIDKSLMAQFTERSAEQVITDGLYAVLARFGGGEVQG